MNQLSIQDRVQILNCLSEGMGVNAAARMTGKSKNTVLKLLADVGQACALYQDRAMNDLHCERIECDETWSFVGAKQKNVRKDKESHAEFGDCYTFTAIDPITKLMPCWLVATRTREATEDFMNELGPAPRQSRSTHHRWMGSLPACCRYGLRRACGLRRAEQEL